VGITTSESIMKNQTDTTWDLVVTPQRKLFDIRFREIWEYRDLLYLFVKRDIIIVYKQTIFGPVWYFVQPLLTMIVYIIVFSNIARIPTDEIPPPVFYLAGIVMWNYFNDCFVQTSDVFHKNSALFGKIYFPRIITPLSKVISGLIQFLIQSALFAVVFSYYFYNGMDIQPGLSIALIPYLVLLMAGLGMGAGLIFSALTAKYRDLKFLVTFGVQLLMYATPVIYPMSIIPEKYRVFIAWNPLAHIIEGFKLVVLGVGQISFTSMFYTTIVTLMVLSTGIIIFNKTEQTFADTV
jgi:lipopolysaccharide transport system permease protein